MQEAFITVGLTFVGIFVAQYALGLLLRLRRVFLPLTEELSPRIHDGEALAKLKNKQKTEGIMALIILFLGPFLVLIYAGQWWVLAPYFGGFLVGALLLWGKCGPTDRNMYLYFHNYRFYLKNELSLYDDPAYEPYMTYRRRSLVEQALDAEEKKQAEKAAERAEAERAEAERADAERADADKT